MGYSYQPQLVSRSSPINTMSVMYLIDEPSSKAMHLASCASPMVELSLLLGRSRWEGTQQFPTNIKEEEFMKGLLS